METTSNDEAESWTPQPGITKLTKLLRHPVANTEIRTALSFTHFTQTEHEGENEIEGERHCFISVYMSENKWLVDGFQMKDQWGQILFYSHSAALSREDEDKGVLVTQRGQRKKYKNLDTLVKEFTALLGPRGKRIELGISIPELHDSHWLGYKRNEVMEKHSKLREEKEQHS